MARYPACIDHTCKRCGCETRHRVGTAPDDRIAGLDRLRAVYCLACDFVGYAFVRPVRCSHMADV